MVDIPDDVAKLNVGEEDIPLNVTELERSIEAPESKPYLISFAKYNETLCEIQYLGKNKGNRALFILKTIGTKVFKKSDFQKCHIDNKCVINSGEYKKLYRKLDPSIEIRELDLQGTGRIFYFDIEAEKILYVVAITENHFEVDKNRR